MEKEQFVAKKRFRKRSELIKRTIANIPKATDVWTQQERLCRNVLQLNGIKYPTLEEVRYVIRQQQLQETNKKYKELTCTKQ